MSAPAHDDQAHPEDPIEAVTKHIPVVIPVAGAILIFLLAFIAVKMARRPAFLHQNWLRRTPDKRQQLLKA